MTFGAVGGNGLINLQRSGELQPRHIPCNLQKGKCEKSQLGVYKQKKLNPGE